eukprot:s689_g12.t1
MDPLEGPGTVNSRAFDSSWLSVPGMLTRFLDKEEGKARDDREGLRRHLEANERMASYLERCSPLVSKHDNAAVGRFLEGLADLGKKDFTDDEVLQLVNMGPIDPLYIFGICEDSDRRFSDSDLQHICGLAQQHLGATSLAPDPESAEEVEQEPAEARLAAWSLAEIQPLSTGAAPLDEALGGGLPCGQIIEVIGATQSGKTSLALSLGRFWK